MTRALGGQGCLSLFHHAEEIGSFVLGEVVRKVALVGFDYAAIPVSIDNELLLEKKENIKIPKFEKLKKISSEDNVFAKMSNRTGHDKVRIRNAIILPPWIVNAIVKGDAGLFGEAFMAVLEAAKAKDTIHSVDSGKELGGSQNKDGNHLKN
eukprot:4796430-Ditylum_brightwellii.AAC.1